MTSEVIARNLTYYFERDGAARGRNFYLSTAVGALALAILRQFDFTEKTSLSISAICVIFSQIALLLHYLQQPKVAPESSLPADLRKRRSTPQPTFALSRRRLVVQLVFLGLASLCIVLSPRPSIAEVVNRRLRRLLAKADLTEARALAKDAIEAGIPLKQGVVTAGSTVHTDSGDIVAPNLGDQGGPNSIPMHIELESNTELILLWPIFYLPPGKYRFATPVKAGRPYSIAGDGPDRCNLLLDMKGTGGSPAMFTYESNRPVDVLIQGFNVTPLPFEAPVRTGASFLSVAPAIGRVVVSHSVLRLACQSLDRVIWENVSFVGCTVKLDGDWFSLTFVTFTDCDFEFAPEIPEAVRDRVQHSDLRRPSLNFRP